MKCDVQMYTCTDTLTDRHEVLNSYLDKGLKTVLPFKFTVIIYLFFQFKLEVRALKFLKFELIKGFFY